MHAISPHVPTDAANVVAKNPMMAGCSVTINLLETSPAQQEDLVTCAIEVKDLDPAITDERLELFFENERRSGGGNIMDLEYDAERRLAVITFETPQGQHFISQILINTVLQQTTCFALLLAM